VALGFDTLWLVNGVVFYVLLFFDPATTEPCTRSATDG